MEVFWFGSGFLFVLNGHEIQGYSLFCPSTFTEKYHHRMQKYRSESTRQHIPDIVSKHCGYVGTWCKKRGAELKEVSSWSHYTLLRRAYTQVPKYGLGA